MPSPGPPRGRAGGTRWCCGAPERRGRAPPAATTHCGGERQPAAPLPALSPWVVIWQQKGSEQAAAASPFGAPALDCCANVVPL